MLSSFCGIDNSIEIEQSTANIKNWLNIFKADPTIAYKAASRAQAAVDFVLKSAGVCLNSMEED
jgi:antirestriction protein ArdC